MKNNFWLILLCLVAFTAGYSINSKAISDTGYRVAVVDVQQLVGKSSQLSLLKQDQQRKLSEMQKTVEQAKKEKVELTAVMGVEMELEGLIKAVGFEDAVVIASSENVSVILKAETLGDEQVARVLQIITDETGKTASNVRIIPIE